MVANLTLRLPDDLHEKLREEAEAERRSLHAQILCRLEDAEIARLRRIAAAAQRLADHLPPNGAATPHTPLTLGEYGTALLYTLRDALAGVGDA